MEEPIDNWLKDGLEGLPETVPFDPEALWKSIQQAQKAPKRRWPWALPVAAGILLLAGLVTSAFFATVPVTKPVAKAIPHVPVRPALRQERPVMTPVAATPLPRRAPVSSGKVHRQPVLSPAEAAPSVPAVAPEAVAVVTSAPEQQPVTQPETKPAMAKAGKPRFRISHINDLREEEETRAKVYKSESFVRMNLSEISPGPSPSLSTRNKPL